MFGTTVTYKWCEYPIVIDGGGVTLLLPVVVGYAGKKLTHTHTPFHAGCCSMKSAHRHVEHEIACVGMEENNALFMFHYL